LKALHLLPTGMEEDLDTAPLSYSGLETFVSFTRAGFVHVVPRGLDHILFIVGIFLLSRRWRPLLWQVTMFTVAHTLSLGLATVGLVKLPSSIVEPIIAASIVFVAVENIWKPEYTRRRLVLVFFFGLIHGLGFAGALSNLELSASQLVVGLLGFNIGVEGGQLAVLFIAFTLTVWIRNDDRYRKAIVIPGSAIIALTGVVWVVQRIF